MAQFTVNSRRLDPYKNFRFRVDVSGAIEKGDLENKVIEKPSPTLSSDAKAAGASGAVTVFVVVDEKGHVIAARSLEGHPLLRRSAIAAARNTRFRPTKLSGQPVKVTGVIQYNFVAQ